MATPLEQERYISLETFRADGSGVKTPVWLAPLDGKLVIVTEGTSHKVKRLRKNSKVRVAACGARGQVTGPWFEGDAVVVADPELARRIEDTLSARYGFQYRVLNFFSTLAGRRKRRAFLQITVSEKSS